MQISTEQKRQLEKIGKKYTLRFIILHGSFATGKNHENSDLDIAVLSNEKIDLEKILNIYTEFAKIFPEMSDKLDIKDIYKSDPLFRYHVTRDSKLLYGDMTDYNEYKASSFTYYFDSQDLFRLEKHLVHKFQNYLNKKYA
jgi:uncharacterized protein